MYVVGIVNIYIVQYVDDAFIYKFYEMEKKRKTLNG